MPPLAQTALAVCGFLALAASLVAPKQASWSALAGAACLVVLAVWNVDPVLLLGTAALVAAGLIRRPGREATDGRQGQSRSVVPENGLDATAGKQY